MRLVRPGVFVALLLVTGFPAAAQESAIRKTGKNTLVYDHAALRRSATETATANDPYVLSVGDGEYFQVIFVRTAPQFFSYTISAVETTEPTKLASTEALPESVLALPNGSTAVTMRHGRAFAKYRVSIRLREDLRPTVVSAPAASPGATKPAFLGAGSEAGGPASPSAERDEAVLLHGVSFDLWVITGPEWTVSFSAGFAFSDLTDPKYFVKTDSAQQKTIERDESAEDSARRDIVAMANLYYTRQYLGSLQFGMAFGIGDAGGTSPRYFLGPSVTLGNGFIFSAGPTFGSVKTLPLGQELKKPPMNTDNPLANPGSRFVKGWSASIGFTFIKRESEFKGAFSAATTPSAPAAGSASIAGKYKGDSDGKEITVEFTKDAGKDLMPLFVIIDGQTYQFSAPDITATEFKSNQGTLKFTVEAGKIKLDYAIGNNKGKATKQP